MNAHETTPQGGGTAVSRRAFLGAAMLGAVGAARPRLTRGPMMMMMIGGRKMMTITVDNPSLTTKEFADNMVNTLNAAGIHNSCVLVADDGTIRNNDVVLMCFLYDPANNLFVQTGNCIRKRDGVFRIVSIATTFDVDSRIGDVYTVYEAPLGSYS